MLSEERGLRFGPKGQTKRIEPGDVFILAATNKDAREVSRSLREAGVPFSFYKQDGLFQTDEAREVRDLLAAIDDPGDPGRRGRAWITPFFAVPLAALPDLVDPPDSHPLVKRLIDWNELAGRRRFETLFAESWTTAASFAASCSSRTMSGRSRITCTSSRSCSKTPGPPAASWPTWSRLSMLISRELASPPARTATFSASKATARPSRS